MVFTEYLLCNKCERDPCCPCIVPKSVAEAKRVMGLGVTLFIVGMVFLGLGFFIPNMLTGAINTGLTRASSLDSLDSRAYNVFVDNSDYPIMMDVYVMNVTNSHDVVNNGAKPKLQEIGPFVYKQFRKAYNLTWSPDASEVSWKYYIRYEFVPSASVMPDTTEFVTPNMAFWGIINQLIYTRQDVLNVFLNNANYQDYDYAFYTRSVKDAIFGYKDDPLLTVLHKMVDTAPTDFPGLISNHTSVEDMQSKAKLDTIRTGFPDISTLRQYVKWQEQEYLSMCTPRKCPGLVPTPSPPWGTKEAGQIIGSDGGAFPSPVRRTDSPYLYAASFYRAVKLRFVKDSQVKGIKTYRFALPQDMWRSVAYSPNNAVYNQLTYNGVLNISAAVEDLPAFISRPRFLSGPDPVKDKVSESLTSQVEATWQNDNVDTDTYFDVEPISGGSMNVMSTSQFNMQIFNIEFEVCTGDFPDDCPDLFPFETVKKLEKLSASPVMPIFWARQYVTLSDDDAASFRDNVYPVLYAAYVFPIISFSVSGVICFLALLVFVRGYRHYTGFREEGHIFVETDNVDTNFGITDSLESVNLDHSTSFAHYNARARGAYGSTVAAAAPPRQTPAPAAAPAAAPGAAANRGAGNNIPVAKHPNSLPPAQPLDKTASSNSSSSASGNNNAAEEAELPEQPESESILKSKYNRVPASDDAVDD